MQAPVIARIEALLGQTLQPAAAYGFDPVSRVMPIRKEAPLRYLWHEGHLAGLNLAGAGIDDDTWRGILAAIEPEAAHLQALNLRDNALTAFELPPAMRSLHYLDLSSNQLREFTPPAEAVAQLEHLWLYDNKDLATPPPEIVSQGRYAIAGYFRELALQGSEKLYEAKLVLVGDGPAGKTTLRRKLLDADAPLPTADESTKGVEIDIDQYNFTGREGKPFRVNVWDFAGQEKYQAIHQFFYTHRALYVLVENAREQKTDFDFWFQTIALCSDQSPVVVVHNEFGDQNRGVFHVEEYQGRYGSWIKANVRVNLATKRDLSKLKAEIEHQLQDLPHVGEQLPKQWAEIRRALRRLSAEKPYITLERYLEICADHGLPEEERALALSRYLHILGAMLHYADNKLLKKFVILQNEWATDAAYKILEDEDIVFKTRGRFTGKDLERIWQRPDYARMCDELLELMKKFKLCYQVRNEDLYIAPQLLPDRSPEDHQWTPANDLRLHLQYAFMPKGLLTRFIVMRHTDIAGGQMMVWKNGVVLEWNGTRAEVTEHYRVNDGVIQIRVQGGDPKGFLSIINKTWDEIHDDFKGIHVERRVPCNCLECTQEPGRNVFFPLSRLEEMRRHGASIQCEKPPYRMVNVAQLIENVFPSDRRGIEHPGMQEAALPSIPKKVFLSYSHDKIDDAKRLKTALAVQAKTGKINFWYDQEILAGAEWKKEIENKLGEADIIVLLLSPEFWASDFIWDKELPLVAARYAAGAQVLCVMLTDNSFKDTPWSALQAVPQRNARLTPISRWSDKDEAWQAVAGALNRMLG
jgi:internalin A